MVNRVTGPILTDTRKEVLREEYEAPSRQAEDDHRRAIRGNTEGALRDLQYLFQYLDQAELEDVIGRTYETDESEETLISHYDHRRERDGPLGYVSDKFFSEYYDEDEKPRDPEYNPDAKTQWEQFIAETSSSRKTSPETQKTLIDCVAFLCRAAEAGSLNVHELIERGVERYYRTHSDKDRRIANLNTWREDIYGGRIKADHKGPSSFDIPRMGDGIFRFLVREGCDI